MKLSEAVDIMRMPDPAVCGYRDLGKKCHLMNEDGYCVICSKSSADLKALKRVYEKAKDVIISIK